jgi:hypothetical protein
MQQTLMNTKELSDYLKISTKTLERMRLNGDGPAYIKVGRRVLYSDLQIETYISERSYQSTAEYQLH